MKRIKYIISGVIVAVMLFSMSFRINIGYTKAIEIPSPIVDGLAATYMVGSQLYLKLTATGTTKLVQYKVVVKNEVTGKIIDILNGYTPKYYNPRYSYPLIFTINESGRYTLSITAKPGGYKDIYSRTMTRTFNVISNTDTIKSIAPVSFKVNIGEAYTLPTKIEAHMNDGSKENVDIKWDNIEVDTSEIGVKTYFGSVTGYNQKVNLTLSVVDEKIISIDDIVATIDEGSKYTFPKKITAKLKNKIMDVDVIWDKDILDSSKPGKYTFIGKAQGYEKAVNLTVIVNTTEIKLTSVYTTNLKEIAVVFNKKILRNTVINDNFKLFLGNTQVPVNADLQYDESTVILTILGKSASLNIGDTYKLVVEGAKDYNSQLIEKTLMEFTPEDKDIPSVKRIFAINSKSLTIEFSEPIKYTGTGMVEIRNNNKIVPINNVYTGYDTDTVTISFNYPMTVTAKYDVIVKGFMDFAGKSCPIRTDTYSFLKDAKKIEAKLKYIDETYAIVEFTKYLNGVTRYNFINNTLGNYSLGVYKNKEMTIPVTSVDFVNKVWIKFYDKSTKNGYPFTESVQKFIIKGNYNGIQIQDVWGEPLDDVYFPVTVTTDKKQPQILSMKVESESVISVKFDESVNLTISNLDVFDGTGRKVQIINILKKDESSFSIVLGKNYTKNNIMVNIKNVEDMAIRPNKLASYTRTLFIDDITPPKVDTVIKKFIPGLEHQLYVYFNEGLNPQGIEKYGFYLQNPSSNIMKKLVGKPIFSSRDSNIIISLTNEERDKVNLGYNIFVSSIQDKSNNVLDGQIILNTQITSYDSTNNKPLVEKIEALGKRNLKVTFNQYLSKVDETAFMVNEAYPEGFELSTNDKGNTVVKITVQEDKAFNSDLSGIAILRIITNSNIKVENEFGINADARIYTIYTIPFIEDKIPPALKQISVFSASNSIVDTIVLEYEENIDVTKLSSLTYSVAGRSIYRVYTNAKGQRGISSLGRFVIIELKTTDVINASDSDIFQVTQLVDIYDMHDNRLSPKLSNNLE